MFGGSNVTSTALAAESVKVRPPVTVDAAQKIVPAPPAVIEQKVAGVENSAFFFIKPHAVTQAVQDLVKEKLTASGLVIVSTGVVAAETIDTQGFIDTHYGAIASRALKQKPDELVVALEQGLVYNSAEAAEKLGIDPLALGVRAQATKRGESQLKFEGGFYVAKIDDMYVVNGFYSEMRSKFTKPGTSIVYFEVRWDPAVLCWADFRGKFIGATNPTEAAEGSLREMIFKQWSALGLPSEPTTGDNGVHASASPFEGLAEKSNWLSASVTADPLGQALISGGVPESTLRNWMGDPAVMFEGKLQSLFGIFEDLDAQPCVDKAKSIAPAPPAVAPDPPAADAAPAAAEAADAAPAEAEAADAAPPAVENSAFLFIKPHAVTQAVQDLVKEKLTASGLLIVSTGIVAAETIDTQGFIDTHYGVIASRALKQKPDRLVVQDGAKQEFEKLWGLSWESALGQGPVYNSAEAAEKLGIDPLALGVRAQATKRGESQLKFEGGFYVAKIDDMYVVNGFYSEMRSKFTKPGTSIVYFEVRWDTAVLCWADFRGKFIGATNPTEAAQGSLREMIFKQWSALGLPSEPTTGDNGVHASASPFEGLAEKSNWLSASVTADPLGQALISGGVPEETLRNWMGDPADLDAQLCIDKAKMMAPAPPAIAPAPPAVIEEKVAGVYVHQKAAPTLGRHSARKVVDPRGGSFGIEFVPDMEQGRPPVTVDAAQKIVPAPPAVIEQKVAGVENSAFLFIKPHAVTQAVQDLVKEKLTASGLVIVSTGVVAAETIDTQGFIDTHYGAIASRALKQKPAELVVQDGAKQEFEKLWGLSWESALEQGLVYNSAEAAEKLGIDPLALGVRAQATKRGESQLKFEGGFYVAKIDDMYVVNGFYSEMRSKFTKPGTSIVYFEVRWDPAVLCWADFRGKFIGATNPTEAAEGSLREMIFKQWSALGLPSEPTTGDNGVHASASPFEGLAEKSNWLSASVTADPLGQALISGGVPESTLRNWMGDPAVMFEGKLQSLFGIFEDLDAQPCVDKAKSIAPAPPAPHAVTQAVQDLVKEKLTASGLVIVSTGVVAAETIDTQGFIDTHYGAIASRALKQKPAELVVQDGAKQEFEKLWGLSWESALEQGLVYNSAEAAEKLGIDPLALGVRAQATKRGAVSAKVTKPGTRIVYFEAAEGSLREMIFKQWPALGLPSEPTTGDNGVPRFCKAIRGPCREALISGGVPESTLRNWMGDPAVMFEGKLQSLFGIFEDLDAQPCVDKAKSIAPAPPAVAPDPPNSAFLFIKPHAVTQAVQDLVKEKLTASGLVIVSTGVVAAETIDTQGFIDTHYGAIASRALKQKPAELVVQDGAKQEFEKLWGLSWESALEQGLVYNSAEAAEKLGIDPLALGVRAQATKRGESQLKFEGGFYVAKIDDMYVVNGFYSEMRSKFTKPGTSIVYFEVRWDPAVLCWADFRGKFIGATNATEAAEGSLREMIFKQWSALGLPSEPTTGDNGVHASASPFEGLAEKSNWLSASVTADPLGQALISGGVPESTLRNWMGDPAVMFEVKLQSLFGIFEDLDAQPCVDKAKSIAPAPPAAADAAPAAAEAADAAPAEAEAADAAAPAVIEQKVAGVENSAFLFIKPHAVTQAVQDLVKEKLTASGLVIVSTGVVAAETIDTQGFIDTHYGAIASRALKQKPAELIVQDGAKQEFEKLWGLSWESALEQRLVYNSAEAVEKLGIDLLALGVRAQATKRGESQLKFEGGFYVAKIDDMYVVNGFYSEMRSKFTKPGTSIVYFEVRWDPAVLCWADFRGKFIGATNPTEAAEGSLREMIFKQWSALGLPSEPTTGENGVHASASPFEGLAEKSNWLSASVTADPLGQALISGGVPESTLRNWMGDPTVMFEGKLQSLFGIFEDLDAQPCVDKAKSIAPAPPAVAPDPLAVIEEKVYVHQKAAPTLGRHSARKVVDPRGGSFGIEFVPDMEQGRVQVISDSVQWRASCFAATVGIVWGLTWAVEQVPPMRQGGGTQPPVTVDAAQKIVPAPPAVIEQKVAGVENSAFLFIKPHAVTQAVQDLVKEKLTASGLVIVSTGVVAAETIDTQGFIDTHYGAIASRALKQKPAELVVQDGAKQEFEKLWGLSWESALGQGLVYNSAEAAEKLGIDPLALGVRAQATKRGESQLKFEGGFYVAKLDDMYVVNGFYSEMRSKFTKPGTSIVYFEVRWDPAVLCWADFRGKFIGATNPTEAAEGSLREMIFKQWSALGLPSEPTTGDNGVHASASPFEGLAEKSNWLSASVTADPLGQALISGGVPESTLRNWMGDPAVMFEGKLQSLFGIFEDLDAQPCVDKAKTIAPAPPAVAPGPPVDSAAPAADVADAPAAGVESEAAEAADAAPAAAEAADAAPAAAEAADAAPPLVENSAFLFIKPHAVTQAVQDLVKEKLTASGLVIVSTGVVAAETIDTQGFIDTHYGAIASRALKQKPSELVVQDGAKQEFEKLWGLSWESALEQGLVYNSAEAAEKLGIDPLALGVRAQATKRGESQLKFEGGFYVAKIDDMYVVNGFYSEMRSKFTKPGTSIVYFEVRWDPAVLCWADFRGKFIGATNPTEAAEGSLREMIFKQWSALGLPSEPTTGENGVHASASPFEGLAEKSNWLSASVTADPLGQALISGGVPESTLRNWMGDPAVMFEGKLQSLFGIFEDLDAQPCVDKAKTIAPAPPAVAPAPPVDSAAPAADVADAPAAGVESEAAEAVQDLVKEKLSQWCASAGNEAWRVSAQVRRWLLRGQVDDMYVVNGFYSEMRSKFTKPGTSIVYFEVRWDPAVLCWADFRGKFIGATNPTEAAEGSLREMIFKQWSALGLPSEPTTGENGVHASASPFEGLAEKSNWLSASVTADPWGQALISGGVPEETLRNWMGDPAVMFEGKLQSLFGIFEDLDAQPCIDKAKQIGA
ncbi:unnamed protein product [Polarella glacialis]|uniref:Nucleoside-diphosphate kinase n=1 Tax=Polarella glacialis TaxID=89957 RepID=A0A813L993_POLGL|nr:unnamed protein product [Polarella glacialis]